MDWILYALGALVVLGVVFYLVVLRKKPEALPEAARVAEPEKAARAPEKASRAKEPAKAPERADAPAREGAEPEKKAPPPAAADDKPRSAEPAPPETKVTAQPPPEVPPTRSRDDEKKAPPPPPSNKKRKAEIAELRRGLTATRGGFVARLAAIFTGKKEIDPAILADIEEVMLTSDVGVKTTARLLERLKERLAKNELGDADAVWAALRDEAVRILSIPARSLQNAKERPLVVLMVGVNGVGKTTTIGKLATRFIAEGRTVSFAAGDTFRAAAVQQLEVWGKRVGAAVVKGKDGADPGAVAFEATQKAIEGKVDVLLVDTAGRLQTKAPLMDELRKVRKTIAKALDGAPHETLLVLDATTGQNALVQAQMFKDTVDLTGIILTKLDGTAKGGVVLAIADELKVPVRYVGLGERAEDLREFSAEEFAIALFGQGDDEARAA